MKYGTSTGKRPPQNASSWSKSAKLSPSITSQFCSTPPGRTSGFPQTAILNFSSPPRPPSRNTSAPSSARSISMSRTAITHSNCTETQPDSKDGYSHCSPKSARPIPILRPGFPASWNSWNREPCFMFSRCPTRPNLRICSNCSGTPCPYSLDLRAETEFPVRRSRNSAGSGPGENPD